MLQPVLLSKNNVHICKSLFLIWTSAKKWTLFLVSLATPHINLLSEKQTMSSLHGLMTETARQELRRLPEFVQECSMLYMPHLGYLLGVKEWAPNLTMMQKELPDMKFMVILEILLYNYLVGFR